MPRYDKLLEKLSRPSPLLIVATASTLLIAIPAIRITLLHRQLSRRITSHETRTGDAARNLLTEPQTNDQPTTSPTTPKHDTPTPSPTTDNHPTALLPPPLLATPTFYNLFHDISTLSVPASTLPPQLATHDLLTAYLQHTMTLFSRTPQAYALWAMSRDASARRSFDREWIESLPFEEGGLVCGVYRVLGRGVGGEVGENGWVCFGMAMNGVEGRLVVAVTGSAHGKEARRVFRTETWMWVPREAGVVMPMERALPRLMHRLGSQWLLVKGTEWLQGLVR